MYDEWKTSAHARAQQSAAYTRMFALAKDATCARCHAPLASRLPEGDLVVDEGVTCEVCHNVREVAPAATGTGVTMLLGADTKYGPLCDAKDHYFHKMGCSPLHQKPDFCASCHWWVKGELPIYTEYVEWRDEFKRPRTCQSCHMPGVRAEVAAGEGMRDGVSNHGLLGNTNDLRKRALTGTASVARRGDKLAVTVDLHNKGAGHRVPTGQPERRIVVRLTTDSGRAEQRLGRKLVGADGKPAPFYTAQRVASDDRIAPKSTQQITLLVDLPKRGNATIDVEWHAIDPDLAAALQITDPEVIPLLHGSASVQKLPAKIELE